MICEKCNKKPCVCHFIAARKAIEKWPEWKRKIAESLYRNDSISRGE